jgi:hypothetical protein
MDETLIFVENKDRVSPLGYPSAVLYHKNLDISRLKIAFIVAWPG